MCILIWPVAVSATDITIARSVVEATFSTAVSIGFEGGGNKLSFVTDGTSCSGGGGSGGGGGGGGSGNGDGVFFASALFVEGL